MKKPIELNHTPGPWHVGGHVGKFESEKISYIGIGGGGAHLARAAITGLVNEAEAAANARLIAAAPELLATLQAIAEMADRRSRINMPDGLSLRTFAGLAIAKATVAE